MRSERVFLVNPVIVQLYPYMSAIIIYLLQLFLYHALLSVERIIDTWNYYKRKDGSVYETSYYCDCHRFIISEPSPIPIADVNIASMVVIAVISIGRTLYGLRL